MFCFNCGAKIADGSNFCPFCGAKITNSVKDNQIHVGNGDPSMRPQQRHASTNACTSFMLSSHTLYENSGCHCTATANR